MNALEINKQDYFNKANEEFIAVPKGKKEKKETKTLNGRKKDILIDMEKISSLMDEYENEIKTLKDKNTKLNDENKEIKKKIKECKQENDSLKRTNEDKINSLEDEMKKIKKSISEEIISSQEKNYKLIDEVKREALIEIKKALKDEINTIKGSIGDGENKKINELKNDIVTTVKQEINEISKLLRKSEIENESTNNKISNETTIEISADMNVKRKENQPEFSEDIENMFDGII